ncbi:MAG: hypothetical protein V3W03_02615, partial [Gammaproteobacteria bacterium]
EENNSKLFNGKRFAEGKVFKAQTPDIDGDKIDCRRNPALNCVNCRFFHFAHRFLVDSVDWLIKLIESRI